MDPADGLMGGPFRDRGHRDARREIRSERPDRTMNPKRVRDDHQRHIKHRQPDANPGEYASFREGASRGVAHAEGAG